MAGRVMFPSSHDIVDIPSIKEACFITLGKLLESNNKVLITTKPRFSIIKEIHKRFSGYTKYIQFRFTITSMDNILLRFWEPNAPLFEERLESLKYAFDRNYKTSVSIEPFLDRQPRDLVNKLERFCTESIWIGKMNYIPSESNIPRDMRPFYYDVRKNYEINQLYKIYNDLKKRRKIKFKDSIKIALTNHS
jgi:DNA repair photolyase